MRLPSSFLRHLCRCVAGLAIAISNAAHGGGGYFSPGYGPVARQTAGAVTAVAEDAFAGASNPAKLIAAGNRFEIGLEIFNPYRKIKRTGATGPGSVYNFSSKSKNPLFLIPEFAYSRQVNKKLALGVTVYANGGLNTDYNDTTGIPATNGNPAVCGARPGNFLLGCGELGFDLSQIVVAPTAAWKIAPGHSIGIAPLIAVQAFKAYGLQAFALGSRYPNSVSNRGYSYAYGAGMRIGWYGEMRPWLNLGAAYSTKVYMQDFDKYKGLLAEGSFDIPANYNFGVAVRPHADWLIAVDIQRIEFGEVRALGNSLLNSLLDPVGSPSGSSSGSGFGWGNQTTYKLGIAYQATPRLKLRTGFAYGRRPNDNDINSVTFNMLAPNQLRSFSAGFSWQTLGGNELHMAAGRFQERKYRGPSGLFPGATESVTPHVNKLSVAWSRKL
jgi:long-chain fatty acid transport protein